MENVPLPLVAAALTASVSFIIFVMTQITALVVNRVEANRNHKNLTIGLYVEITYNTRIVTEFLKSNPSSEVVEKLVAADSNYLPHLTYAHHTGFYEGQISKMPSLKPILSKQLIEFYCNLYSLEADIEAIYRPAYKVVRSRDGVMRDLWDQMRTCQTIGVETTKLFEAVYPEHWFKNFKA